MMKWWKADSISNESILAGIKIANRGCERFLGLSGDETCLLKKKKSAPLRFISNMVRSWLPSYANWDPLRKEICGVGSAHGKRVVAQKNPFAISSVTPTDDVYLPVRPIRLRPLNQKSNVRLSWHSVHDKGQPVKSPGVLVSVVRYCINGKMKLSATVLTRLCVNITNLPWKQNAMRCGRKSPD